MGFSIGLVGLPNVGKSTIFNAITSLCAEASNYPFCTIEPSRGVVPVPDDRMPAIMKALGARHIVPTSLTVVDIAGLVRGASKGEGLGNQFLGHIRNVDGIAHVVRCFDDSGIVHVDGAPDPLRDVETIELELALADLDVVTRRDAKIAKVPTPEARKQHGVYERLIAAIDADPGGGAVRDLVAALNDDERAIVTELDLFALKPAFFIANTGDDGGGRYLEALTSHAEKTGRLVVAVSGQIEAELAQMDGADRDEMLGAYAISEDAVHRIVRTGYELLGLVTFFTAKTEVRAWTVPAGTTAPKAAAEIHTDMERGFIRAEVIGFDDLVAAGSEHAARERGVYRVEGRDYVVRDGDVILFRFNV